MKTNRTVGIRMMAVLMSLAMGAAPMLAQSPAAESTGVAKKVSKSSLSKPTAPAEPRSGPREGIKVHGLWLIEIRNPDGTLVLRRQFNNALSDGGRQTLGLLLSHSAQLIGKWQVLLSDGGNVNSPCQGGVTGSGAPTNTCLIIEPGATNPFGGNAESQNLQVSQTGTGLAPTVTLAGSITAIATGTVGRVSTRVGTCASAPCNTIAGPNLFSDASLPNPIPVVAGQIIQVTVIFSFS